MNTDPKGPVNSINIIPINPIPLNFIHPSDIFTEIGNEINAENIKIHIRIRQRTGKKMITSIENLPPHIDGMSILKEMRKKFACTGNLGEKTGIKFIQLSGDQRETVKKFLVSKKIVTESNIVVHGF